MPRRSGDQGVKPFELRTGIGGLPPLGGIYRAGDPATCPPHKHHQAVNARVTPSGMFSRPGLKVEFDTGVEECITGLTEYPEFHGQSLLVYPGCQTRFASGDYPNYNHATFRVVFPGTSLTASEYVFVLEGQAAVEAEVFSPVVVAPPICYGNYGPGGFFEGFNIYGAALGVAQTGTTKTLSNPFLFRDKIYQFRAGPTEYEWPDPITDYYGQSLSRKLKSVAIYELALPVKANISASDCARTTRTVTSLSQIPVCDESPEAGPASVGQLWPYLHPVAQSKIKMELLNSDVSFYPLVNSARGQMYPYGMWMCEPGLSVYVRSERSDNPVSGVAGVADIVYFLVNHPNEYNHFYLMRWDGVACSIEHSIETAFGDVATTSQEARPFIVVGSTEAGPFVYYQYDDEPGLSDTPLPKWVLHYRDADGAWHTDGARLSGPSTEFEDGANNVDPTSPWTSCSNVRTWKAFDGGMVLVSLCLSGPLIFLGGFVIVRVSPERGDAKNIAQRVYTTESTGTELHLIDASMAGGKCYALVYEVAAQRTVRLGCLDAKRTIQIADWAIPEPWIQAVGDRVFVGGCFTDDWDPEIQGETTVGRRHAIFDVTDLSNIFCVYSVLDVEQTQDGDPLNIGERYSKGCLPGLPSGGTTSEGFGGSYD